MVFLLQKAYTRTLFWKGPNASFPRWHTSFVAFLEVHLHILMAKAASQMRLVLVVRTLVIWLETHN